MVTHVLGDVRRAQVHVLQEAVRDADKRVLWPVMKPVDAGAVYLAGKTAGTGPKQVPNYNNSSIQKKFRLVSGCGFTVRIRVRVKVKVQTRIRVKVRVWVRVRVSVRIRVRVRVGVRVRVRVKG